MFEQATRQKFRFNSPAGLLTVEDLWELPLTSRANRPNLDDIARALHRRLKNDENVSFVNPEQKSDPTDQLMFDLVKYIIEKRLTENKAEQERQVNAQKKQRLLAILAKREDQELEALPMEELRAAVEAL